MAEHHKWVAAVSKLNELTHEGRLKWERQTAPDSVARGVNDRIFNFFGTSHEGRNFGIWEERFQVYNDDIDQYVWQQDAVLGVFTEEWDLQVRAPDLVAVAQLFETVRHQEANLDELFDNLLSDKPKDDDGG